MSFSRFIAFVVLCVAFLIIGGCAKPTPIGKWDGQMDVQGIKLATTMDFKPDGTLTQTTKSPIGTMSADATYKVNDDKIAIHVDKVKLGSAQIPIPAQGADQNATFKIEGDKLTLTRDGKDVSFTRVKE